MNSPRGLSKYFILLVGFFALAGYTIVYVKNFNYPPIRSDGEGYYAYLPSYVIHNDLTMEKLAKERFGGDFPVWTGIQRFPSTERFVDKYPIGEALLVAPFFFVGHFLSKILGFEPDGYSALYQHAAGLSGLLYMIAGVFLLKKNLERYFANGVTLATLIAILFGTNLFHYGTYDSIFSHAFSFFLISAFIFMIHKWYEEPKKYIHSVLIGVIAGLIILVRIPNIIVLLFFPLFGINSLKDIKERFVLLYANKLPISLICLVAVLICLPQIFLWKYLTDKWLIMPYQNEGFNFYSPKIFDVLFSIRKGLFFWSPILIFSLLGLLIMRKKIKEFLIPALFFLFINLYIIASWHSWWFGASFGHRAFVESYSILAFPLASFYDSIESKRSKVFVATLSALLIFISIIQMLQYWKGIIPYDGVTWEFYRKIFLKL